LDSIKEWETPDGVAHCKVRRKGEKIYHERTFSEADAKKAGLWDRKNRDGSPGMYQKYPGRMKQMRARGFALRDVFADILGGMYLREELEGVEPEVIDITPPAAPQATETIVPPAAQEPKKRQPKRGERSSAPYAGMDDEREAIGRQITETAQMDAEDQPELFPEDVEVPSAG
jgi:hypothetical protein